MHFGLTDEQHLLQDTLRRFADRAVPATRRREIFDRGDGWDDALWQAAAEVGLQGLLVPASLGGSGLEMLDLALAFEVLGESAVPGPFLGHTLATLAILRGGDEAQRERWLPDLASGARLAGLALAESDEAWTPESWRLAGDRGRLHGTKLFAEIAPATDLLVVGLAGGGLGVVEASASGVHVRAVDALDRARPLAHVDFEDASFERLGHDDAIAHDLVDAGCILLAADAFGAAWKLIRMTTDYALTREQFGTPIAQFQAVKHQLADMAMEAEPMRGLVWHCAWAFDHRRAACRRDAALAKAHITDRALHIGRGAVALHGGIGFTWECDVQLWVKRTMFDRVWLGSPEIHRERAAALGGW